MRAVYRAQAREARRALLLCWALLLVALVVGWTSTFASLPTRGMPSLVTAVFGTAAILLFVRLQLAACRGGGPLWAPWIAPAVVVLSVAPLLWGPLSSGAVVVGGAILVQRPLRLALAELGVALVVLAVVWERSAFSSDVPYLGLVAEFAIFAAVLVAATRLAVLLDELTFARELLARRRVDLERERISRDLHDIMGRTFVAASLRNQAAVREVADGDPVGADRLRQLHETIAKGQAQLRALTSGPTISHLEDELAAARTLCQRVSVDLEIDVRVPPPENHESLVALLVREGVTNVLKHGRATSCLIRLDRVDRATEIVLRNNGAGEGERESPELTSRLERAVAAAGGTTLVDRSVPGVYRVTARIPMAEKAIP